MLDHFDTWWRKALFLVSLLAFAASAATAVLSVSRQIGLPYPGFLLWNNLVVPALAARVGPEGGSAIPYRAVLVAIDGAPVTRAAEVRAAVRAAPLGTPIEYTFLHDGRTQTAGLPTALLRWRDVAPIYLPYLLIGLSFYATGLAVFYFRPTLPAAHAALALGAALGGTLVLALDTLSSFWLERLYFLVEALVPGALLHFAVAFPERKAIAARHRWLTPALYLPSLGLGGLQNLYLRSAPGLHLQVNDWVYAGIAAAGLVSIASLLHTVTTSANPVARQQAKVVAAGVTLAAFVPSLGLLSVVIADLEIPINALSPFFLIFPLSIVYAIARHNLFDVDRFLRLGVVYAALTLVFFAGYAALLVGMEKWSGAERRLPRGAVPLYLLAVLLLLDPLRARVQRLVDRLFYRQAYNYRATVEATSRALAAILDTDRIAGVVLETLTDVMAIEWGAILVLRRRGPSLEPRMDGGVAADEIRAYARPEGVAPDLAEIVRRSPEAWQAAVALGGLWTRYDRPWRGAEEQGLLSSFGAALLVPARFEGHAIALVALGERRSGAFYSRDDLDLIQTLVNQAALALENAHAYEVIQRTQQELLRAERLAAVGELSAAVAHGIRNPLAGIRAAAQVAREEPDDAATVRENLEDIIAEADRLEHRVRTLLDFARPFQPTLVSADLNEFVRRFGEQFSGHRLPPGVTFSVETAATLPPVAFDAVQMTEVLEALVVNALEAMAGRGTLAIRTRYEPGGERPVVLAVSDSGPGIDPAHQRRIFDLFYTTKGSGSGIGLAAVKRLVDRHGGEITVRSAKGEGTTFEIRFAA